MRERENSVDVTLPFQIIVQLVYNFCKPPSNYKVGTSGFCHLKNFGKVKNPTERKKEKKKKEYASSNWVLVRFVFCSKILKKKSYVCKTLERRRYCSTVRDIYTRDFTRLLHLSQIFDRLLLPLLVAKGKCFEYKTQRKGFLLGQKNHGRESTVVWEWNAGTLCERSVFAASGISRVRC